MRSVRAIYGVFLCRHVTGSRYLGGYAWTLCVCGGFCGTGRWLAGLTMGYRHVQRGTDLSSFFFSFFFVYLFVLRSFLGFVCWSLFGWFCC